MVNNKQYFELQQGDILFLDFDPTLGHEQRGYRPCIVLTKSLKYLNYMFGVAPITSNSREFPLHLPLPEGMNIQGKVLLEHHRMVDLETRKFNYVESAGSEFTEECVAKLKLLY
ncbi:type II toxin-antitoxin system PemK/MazF family toxin [Candidatus Enterococcus murrayae]|uniref:Type II toxin-antitoxin system PemK/MazF family toxin n=1 Tax=Candidatus Enterococcus murrayae TaxID=2815321 RepID=A0ABS3HNH9_9ENTE|nr:type II toxin-antitoxin system PemK/MazF family toxin [Enterococcus sp. MJM16]MBO0454883.1 type II toxin-antitoxin system PemK/MazF family toxin [Enterococcus sp. MJM16]